MSSDFFHFNLCRIFFDIELKSASSSGTKSQKLTNKTNLYVMRLLTTQTSLCKCTVSSGHLLLAHTSDPLLDPLMCPSAHKERRRMQTEAQTINRS